VSLASVVEVVDFDHHSEAFAESLETTTWRFADEHAIAYTNSHGGYFIVAAHELAKRVLNDPEVFSSARTPDGGGGVFIPPFPVPGFPAESDPPAHTAIRKLLAPWFSRTAVEELRPKIEAIVSGVFDRIVANGEFDVVTDIGHVVGPTLIIDYLAFPREVREPFMNALRSGYQPEGDDQTLMFEMAGKLMEIIAEKRVNPGDELTSHLIQSTDPKLSDLELVATLAVLMLGGIETTESLIANSFLYLEQDRELRRRLIAHPELIPQALDEFLRVATPETTTVRNATRDVELGGVAVPEGSRVLVLISSANHDARVFADPDTIDIDRKNTASLVFGHGIHRCIGAVLSKIESTIILQHALTRIPDYELDLARSKRFTDRSAANGWLTMPASTTGR
jgi:cytochrome P450